MTLPSFATFDELRKACPSAPTAEGTHALWVVSTAIRGQAGKSFVDDDGHLELTALAAELLKAVTLEATQRRLANPEGATQRSQGMGPFTESVTIDAANVYFTKAEKVDIATATAECYPSGGFPGLGTISTTRGPLETAAACGYESADTIVDDPFGRGW